MILVTEKNGQQQDDEQAIISFFIMSSTVCLQWVLELQTPPLVSFRPLIKFFMYNKMVWSKYWICVVCKEQKKKIWKGTIILQALVQDGGAVIW